MHFLKKRQEYKVNSSYIDHTSMETTHSEYYSASKQTIDSIGKCTTVGAVMAE